MSGKTKKDFVSFWQLTSQELKILIKSGNGYERKLLVLIMFCFSEFGGLCNCRYVEL